jgi:hypothetical protein
VEWHEFPEGDELEILTGISEPCNEGKHGECPGPRAFRRARRRDDILRVCDCHKVPYSIEAGTFGMCVDCHEQITPERLAALPWTASCIVCRESADRSQTLSLKAASGSERITFPIGVPDQTVNS